jgi:hypothetical protein
LEIAHAKHLRLGVHAIGEGGEAAGVVTGEGTGDVVHAMNKEDLEQAVTGVGFAGLEVELARLGIGVGGLDAHDPVEVAIFGNDQPGEQFLGARNRAGGVGVVLVEDAARVGIDDDVSSRADDRSRAILLDGERLGDAGALGCARRVYSWPARVWLWQARIFSTRSPRTAARTRRRER